jgi:hypothetical protein
MSFSSFYRQPFYATLQFFSLQLEDREAPPPQCFNFIQEIKIISLWESHKHLRKPKGY